MHRCFEINRLSQLDQQQFQQQQAEFRQEVKKRLLKANKELLSVDADERKEALADMYKELEENYYNLIRRARLR